MRISDWSSDVCSSDLWDIKRQVFDWVVPVHEGAIKYFKEISVWKPEYDKSNAALVQRQQVLATAWAAHGKAAYADDKAAMAGWQQPIGRASCRERVCQYV